MLCVAALTWCGCGHDETPVNPPSPTPVPDASAGNDISLTGEGFEIVFHEEGFTGSEFKQPSLTIQAGKVSVNDRGEYLVENVKATLYREGRPNAEMIAGRGEVSEDEGIARLADGVVVNAGDMRLELNHIEWRDNDDPPKAVSDAPVRLQRGDSELAATGLVLIPSEESLTLNQVTGHWSSKGISP